MSSIAASAGVLADGGWGAHMGGWGWGGVMMLGWWLLVAVAIVVAVRLGVSGRTPSPERRGPREILAERFANGEIDGAEYRERLQVLERGS